MSTQPGTPAAQRPTVGFNNSYGLGHNHPPVLGMTVYAISPAEPGQICDIVGPDPKYSNWKDYATGRPIHFLVRVRWLDGRISKRSTSNLHDLDARIDDLERQLREMEALRLQLRMGL